ncbi:cytochrome C oxidase subunit IV family protein [Bacteroidota bacterium]
MEKSGEHKIVSFKMYLGILVSLIALTMLSIYVTKIDLGNVSIIVALSIAGVKSLLVFSVFMHLFFDKKMYSLMVIGVLLVLTLVLIITFLDYGY